MPSTTTGVTWYTDRVTTPLRPKAVKGAPGENRALARLRRTRAELLVRWLNRRARGGPAVPSLHSKCNVPWGCLERRNRNQKEETRVDRRSTRVFYIFLGVAECHFFASARRRRCKQPRPETSVAGTAMQDSGHNRAQRGQNAQISKCIIIFICNVYC